MTPLSDKGLAPPHMDRLQDMGAPLVAGVLGRQPRPVSPFLAADLGGTHARIGLVVPDAVTGKPDIVIYKVYRCAEHASLVDILDSFRRDHHVQTDALVLACAGFVDGGAVINESLAWPVLLDSLCIEGGFASVDVLNDFEAFAHAVGHFGKENSTAIVDGVANPSGAVAVIGPGTGLGAALWLPGRPPRVLHTEAGHMELAARPGIEQAIRPARRRPDVTVAVENDEGVVVLEHAARSRRRPRHRNVEGRLRDGRDDLDLGLASHFD